MNTSRPVLIAVDGSPSSERTLRWGMDAAQLRGADVELVHVFSEPGGFSGYAWAPYPLALMDDEVHAKQLLADQAEHASRAVPGVHVRPHLLHGSTVPALLEAAKHAQLLVVGSHSRGHRMLGSTARHVAAHACVPVALVAGDPGASLPANGPVVVGVDGSAGSHGAARVAATEARMRGTELRLVYGWGGTPVEWVSLSVNTSEMNELARHAREQLEATAEALRTEFPGLVVTGSCVRDGAVPAVLGEAREAQLIVVGSRGRGAFTGMLLGSVSQELMRETDRPLMVVHATS